MSESTEYPNGEYDPAEPAPLYMNHMETIYKLLREGTRDQLRAEAAALPVLGNSAPRALIVPKGDAALLYCPVPVVFSPRETVPVF